MSFNLLILLILSLSFNVLGSNLHDSYFVGMFFYLEIVMYECQLSFFRKIDKIFNKFCILIILFVGSK